MKKLVIAGIATLAFVMPFATANASGYGSGQICNPVYGGGSNCTPVYFTITKEVQAPTKGGQYVKNLSVDDAHFAPNSPVNYRITIQNTGNNTISDIKVVDTFPQYVTYQSGVSGSYDAKSNTLTFDVNNLGAGQSQQIVLNASTAATNNLPSDKNVVCVVNTVQGTDTTSGAQAQDNAQICIEKNITTTTPAPQISKPVVTKSTPATGPEDFVLPLLGLTGTLGAFLKRKSK